MSFDAAMQSYNNNSTVSSPNHLTEENDILASRQSKEYNSGFSSRSINNTNKRPVHGKNQFDEPRGTENRLRDKGVLSVNTSRNNDRQRSLSSSPVRSSQSAYGSRQPYYGRRNQHHHEMRAHHGRSKSTSNDLIFVERKGRHANHSHSLKYVPHDFEYKGKLKVKCGNKKVRVPFSIPQWDPTPPPPQQFPYLASSVPICDNSIVSKAHGSEFHTFTSPQLPKPSYVNYYNEVDMHTAGAGVDTIGMGMPSYPEYNARIPPSYTAGTSGLYNMYHNKASADGYHVGYPPIPAGGKIIAQYVRDLDEVYPVSQPVGSLQSSSNYVQQAIDHRHTRPIQQRSCHYETTSEQVIEKCVPKSKIIEVWKRQRKDKRDDQISLDAIKREIVESITNEIKKLDFGDRYHPVIDSMSQKPTERDVKVIVQPIQPVFYLPKQQPVQQTITTIPPSQPTLPHPVEQQPAAAPSVVYVPRNVYVPVIKPVFVPRERVIVRPQIVQVARPVVIDRPIPVAQRPIVIDRERPVPFPVVRQAPHDHSSVQNEHYIYRDNLPLAYGGRTGEFATGMNYGYVPVNENYQYIVSGCDELLRQQLVNKHHQHHTYKPHHIDHQYDSSGYLSSIGGADCFDEALNELVPSGAARIPNVYSDEQQFVHHAQHIPVEIVSNQYNQTNSGDYTTNISIGEENKTALVETLRRAGTGCINLEVLDPTIKPVWEPVDAKMLIQRYGSSAARFVENSGVSYGYDQFSPRNSGGSTSLSNLNASQHKFSIPNRPFSADFSPADPDGNILLSVGDKQGVAASHHRSQHSFGSNADYNTQVVNELVAGGEASVYKHPSNSLKIGGIDQWSTPSQYKHRGVSTISTSVNNPSGPFH